MNTSLITFLSIVAVIGIAYMVADIFLRSFEKKIKINNCALSDEVKKQLSNTYCILDIEKSIIDYIENEMHNDTIEFSKDTISNIVDEFGKANNLGYLSTSMVKRRILAQYDHIINPNPFQESIKKHVEQTKDNGDCIRIKISQMPWVLNEDGDLIGIKNKLESITLLDYRYLYLQKSSDSEMSMIELKKLPVFLDLAKQIYSLFDTNGKIQYKDFKKLITSNLNKLNLTVNEFAYIHDSLYAKFGLCIMNEIPEETSHNFDSIKIHGELLGKEALDKIKEIEVKETPERCIHEKVNSKK